MQTNFILSCESTVDVPFSYIDGRNIPVLFYTYLIDGEEYVDDMLRDAEALPNFYKAIDEGRLPSTSQINEYRYYEFFKELIQKGDVLHLAFSSGLTPSVNNAYAAAEKIRAEYPDKKIIVIDTLCGSSGYGLFVDEAADMRDAGKSMEEVAEWAQKARFSVQHHFYSTDLTMFKRSGRVSGVAATAATILGICPIMKLVRKGSIEAYNKVRGKKNAMQKTIDAVRESSVDGKLTGKCFISHSNCLEEAEATRDEMLKQFPELEDIKIFDIGTIIASHCGKGTVAIYFFGKERID